MGWPLRRSLSMLAVEALKFGEEIGLREVTIDDANAVVNIQKMYQKMYQVRFFRRKPARRDLAPLTVNQAGADGCLRIGYRLADCATASGNSSIISFVDITERIRARRQLEAAGQRFQSVLAGTMDGFMLVDTQGRLLEVNDRLCALTGYSRAELLGLTVTDLHIDESAAQSEQRTARIQAERRIKTIAFYDALTGLPNRQLLADRLQQAIAQASRTERALAVCYLDLDGFKTILK